MEAYDTVYHNDIIALTETQLNQGISDDEIFINGFSGKPFQKDDPRNDRYCDICVYYKENLPIKQHSDLEMLLAEGIVTEIVLGRKRFFIVAVYRPHHMSADNFEIVSRQNSTLAHYEFHTLKQLPLEFFDTFINRVKHEANGCDFTYDSGSCNAKDTLKLERMLFITNGTFLI